MYRRFLNNNDYLGIITESAFSQMTRGNENCIIQAEESAEVSIIEYLSENYEIESELNRGKFIAPYDRRITFPTGTHLYHEGAIHEVIRSISGYKSPSATEYWAEDAGLPVNECDVKAYSQFRDYRPGDRVTYNGFRYLCLAENGYSFGDIRIPMVYGWIEAPAFAWEPRLYGLWEVAEYKGAFYTAISLEDFDNNITPDSSSNWGEIADYDPGYNKYELSGHEYVVCQGKVWHPEIDVNADTPQVGYNLRLHDPRNYNLKKHMVRLALYELTKLIAPNNVSVIRVRDYEDSMKWLSDAARLRLNPQIPRRIARDRKEIMDWQMATFQTDYDPYKNPWLV